MNGLVTILGLAALNESFRQRLIDDTEHVDELVPVLISEVEREVLKGLTDTQPKRDALYAALSVIESKVSVECQTPPYCGPDRDYSQVQPTVTTTPTTTTNKAKRKSPRRR